MKFDRDILLSAIDILLLLVIMFLIGLFAIRYDANKGIGEEIYTQINIVKQKKEKIYSQHDLVFIAIAIKKNGIEMNKVRGKRKLLPTYQVKSMDDLKKRLLKNEKYVIYEEEKNNKFLAQIIRTLAENNVKFWIRI